MIEERVDAILIETCFDILQAKCVAITAIEEMERAGVKLPLMGAWLTIIDANQKMLPGTDIPTALVALEHLDGIGRAGHELRRRPRPDAQQQQAPEQAQPQGS
jgi:5-methyltetrahydrofolate--homocysteine methyltransferase